MYYIYNYIYICKYILCGCLPSKLPGFDPMRKIEKFPPRSKTGRAAPPRSWGPAEKWRKSPGRSGGMAIFLWRKTLSQENTISHDGSM